MRDFDKVIVYFFHVETPPGIWRRSSLLLAPYLGTVLYVHPDTRPLAQAYSNELPAAHVSSNRSYTIHTPATNQISATATTTTDLYVSQRNEASD